MKFIYSRSFTWFTAVLVVTVILLFLQNKGYLDMLKRVVVQAPRPIVKAGQAVAVPTRNFFSTLYGMRGIVKENTELKQQLYLMQERIVLLDQYGRENESLKQELGFKEKSPNALEPCTVLAIDPEGLTDAMVLDCGEEKGVRVGQAVIAQNHLVGKIVYAGSKTSTARMLTSPQALIDARVSKTGEEGLVNGSFNSGIVIDRLSQNAPLETGDIIVTAGINSLIPRNIVIGQVGEVVSRDNDLFKKAAIVSPIRFHNLQYVFVVK
jgi:rod shape-determining protein MreC